MYKFGTQVHFQHFVNLSFMFLGMNYQHLGKPLVLQILHIEQYRLDRVTDRTLRYLKYSPRPLSLI